MAPGAWRLSIWYFSYFAFLGAFAPYFGLYLRDLGIAASGIGLLLALMQLMRLALPGFWSRIGRHRGGRKAAIVRSALILALLAWVGVSATREFSGLFFSVALLALALGIALPLVESLTLDHLAARPDRYSHIRLWGSLGYIVSVQAVGVFLDATSISALIWVCLVLLLVGFVCSMALPESPERLQASGDSGWRDLLRHPGVVAVMVAGFFMALAHAPYYAFYSLHLADHGYGKTAIGALWALGVGVEVVIFVTMPRILSLAAPGALLAFSLGIAFVRFLLIGWWIDALPLTILAQTLHGATFGLHHAASMAALNSWVAPPQRTAALALFGSMTFGAGSLLGALISGGLWDRVGAGMVYTLAAVAAALGMVAIVRLGVLRRSVEL